MQMNGAIFFDDKNTIGAQYHPRAVIEIAVAFEMMKSRSAAH
jgi:hypothetical protein